MMITWIVGAVVLDLLMILKIRQDAPLVFHYWSSCMWLAAALVPLSCLGFFAGGFTVGPIIMRACRKINSAPLHANNWVVILSGPMRGTQARVYEVTKGQGGQNLARLDLGADLRKKYSDIFEQYAVFKI